MKTLLCIAPDGDFQKEGSFKTIEEAWERCSDMGSRWFFYPINIVATKAGANGIIADIPDGMAKDWIGKKVKTLIAAIKSEPDHSLDYANGKTPFCIYP